MAKTSIEPGFLQIFRIYGWIRLITLIPIPFVAFNRGVVGFARIGPDSGPVVIIRKGTELVQNPSNDLIFPGLITLLTTTILLLYLYSSWLEKKLGANYVPIALVYAVAALLVEEHLFAARRGLVQVEPLIYILLVLIAWQYRYRVVALFAVANVLIPLLLMRFFPIEDPFFRIFPQSYRDMTYGLFGSRLITFGIVGYIINRLVSEQRKQRVELAHSNVQLRQYASTLEQLTVSRERNRLSRELHDTLAHTLSALTVQFEALFAVWKQIPKKPLGMLSQMQQTTRNGLDETRRALSALRAAPLEEMGLPLALGHMAEDFADRHELDLTLDIDQNLKGLPPDAEQCFYRVAQEALENTSRHANARKITVRLLEIENQIELSVADDGQGFNPEEVSDEQMGLRGMHERAELVGASLTVTSQPGQGTMILLVLERNHDKSIGM